MDGQLAYLAGKVNFDGLDANVLRSGSHGEESIWRCACRVRGGECVDGGEERRGWWDNMVEESDGGGARRRKSASLIDGTSYLCVVPDPVRLYCMYV